jgi:hypothetical protein
MVKRTKQRRSSGERKIHSIRVGFDTDRGVMFKTVPQYFGNSTNNILIRFYMPKQRPSRGSSDIFAGEYSTPDLVWSSHPDCDVLSMIQRPKFTMIYLRSAFRLGLSKRKR